MQKKIDMSIYVNTQEPNSLVEKIKNDIEQKKIDTWSVDNDGDFTHSAEQWRNRAWFRAKIEEGRVVFFIICRKDKNMSVLDYGIYHGRFVEMLLNHYDKDCKSIEVTPLASKYDIVVADNKNV